MGAKTKIEGADGAKPDQTLKGMSVDALVEKTKKAITDLTRLMNEADKRKITVGFNIDKPVGGLAGSFKITRCEFTQRL